MKAMRLLQNSMLQLILCLMVLMHTTSTHAAAPQFTASIISGTSFSPVSVAAADFNGDGKQDLALLDSNGSVTLLNGTGSGSFQFNGTYPLGSGTTHISVAAGNFKAFGSSGAADLALLDSNGTTVNFFFNNSGSFFPDPDNSITVSSSRSIKGVDFNQDNQTDLLLVDQSGQTVAVLTNQFGGFSSSGISFNPSSSANAATISDLEGNGSNYLVYVDTTGALYTQPTAGGSAAVITISVTNGTKQLDVVAGDFTGDNRNDLILISQGSNNLILLAGIVPPVWSPGYPKAGTVTSTSIELLVNSTVFSNVSMVCLPTGSSAPTAQQVLNGQNASGSTLPFNQISSLSLQAGIESSLSCTNLSSGTSYDLYAASQPFASPSLPAPTLIPLTTAPDPPISLNATQITPSGFTANWNAVTGATTYFLDVSADQNFSTFVANFNNRNTGGLTSFNITGLLPNTPYYFRVRTSTSTLTSTSSSTGSFTTLPPLEAPVFSSVTNISESGFTISWSAVFGATGYALDVSTSPEFSTFVGIYNNQDTGMLTSFAVTGLSPNTTYYYRVRAYASGTFGPISSASTSTLLPPPGIPSSPALTPHPSDATGFSATWGSVLYASGYRIDVSSDEGFTAMISPYNNFNTGSVTSFDVTGLAPGVTYHVRVRAYNISGTSGSSPTATITLVPPPPSARAASSGSTSGFTAVWNASPGASGYLLTVASDSGFTSLLTNYSNRDVGNATSLLVGGTSPGSTYFYRVQAYNNSGTSGFSRTISITIPEVPPITLLAPRAFATGMNPSSSITADFNGDGIADVATANQSENSISIFLGIGDGSFREAVSLPCGNGPVKIVSGDLNQDGITDLVTLNNSGSSISLFLGNGDDTFQQAATTQVGNYPQDAIIGDFTGDGIPDLVLTYGYTNSFKIFPGTGTGSFGTALVTQSSNQLKRIAAGDFNSDGKLDLAFVTAGISYGVVLGNGNGTFQSEHFYSLPGESYHIQSGDLNGDGKIDLAVITLDRSVQSTLPGTLRILLGDGTGLFAVSTTLPCDENPQSLVITDLNTDNALDILVAANVGNNLKMFYGNGDGSFQTPQILQAPGSTLSITVADFDGNGLLDVGLTSFSSSLFTVFFQNAPGNISGPPTGYQPAAHAPMSLTAGDFNKDGKTDLVGSLYVSSTTGAVRTYLGDGSGGLTSGSDIPLTHAPSGILTTDLNKDGADDIVVSGSNTSLFSALLGNGNATFKTPVTYSTTGAHDRAASGDFNGDGIPDLAVADTFFHAVSIFLGKVDGTFNGRTDYPVGQSSYPFDIVTYDFNHDGKLDLAMADYTTNAVLVLLGNGTGGFSAPASYPVSSKPYYLTTGDFNQDGHRDLAVSNRDDNSVSVLLSYGNGTFEPAVHYPAGRTPFQIVSVDLNQDGHEDLVVTNGNGSISILPGKGAGTFLPPVRYWTGNSTALAAGSFSTSGRTDLAVGDGRRGGVMLLMNNSQASFEALSPQVDSTGLDSAQVLVRVSDYGTVYSVCLPSGSPAPGAAQIKAGQNATGSTVPAGMKGSTQVSPHFPATIPLTGLTPDSDYDIHVLYEVTIPSPSSLTATTSYTHESTPTRLLTIRIDGVGTVHSSSTAVGIPSDIVCSSGACSARYPLGSLVNLAALPPWFSNTTWDLATDSRGGNAATVTMNNSRAVTVYFIASPNVQVSNPAGYHGSIKLALDAAADGATIKAKAMLFPDVFTLNRPAMTITLLGGYAQLSDSIPSEVSTLSGPFRITNGRLNIGSTVKITP